MRNLRTKVVYWVNVSEGSGTDSPGLSRAVMLTRTFHQGPGPGIGCQGTGPGQGPGFEYKDQDKDRDLSKCGHISVNIPGI